MYPGEGNIFGCYEVMSYLQIIIIRKLFLQNDTKDSSSGCKGIHCLNPGLGGHSLMLDREGM